MEIKDAIKINPDFSIEDDGFELEFSKEESDMIDRKAREKGVSPETLIREIVEPAIKKAEDTMLKLIKERRKN